LLEVEAGVGRRITAGTINSDDLRTKIGQHHRAERCGAETGELNDVDAAQWTHDRGNLDFSRAAINQETEMTGIWKRSAGI
jgi:hypothetical protein